MRGDVAARREPHADQNLEHRKCQRQAEKQNDLQRAALDQRPLAFNPMQAKNATSTADSHF
jgi:hypothetical protein